MITSKKAPGYFVPVDEAGNVGMQLTGSNVKDSFRGSANTTKTYSTAMHGFSIVNDGTAELTFTINGISVPVAGGEPFDGTFDPFTSVSIVTTVAFRASVRG